MGYRSDVRIMTSRKGYEKLQKHVENYLKEKNIDYNLLENSDLRYVSKNGVLIGWNYIKWYDWNKCSSVDSIMSGLSKLEDEDYSYRYSRIGEDIDDMDEQEFDTRGTDDYIPYIDYVREFDDESMKDMLDEEMENVTEKDKGVEI